MGACKIICSVECCSDELSYFVCAMQEEAERDYGDDPYNGTISTCTFVGIRAKSADNYSDTSLKKAYRLIDEEDSAFDIKRQVAAVDMGVSGYITYTLAKEMRTVNPNRTLPSTNAWMVTVDTDGSKSKTYTFKTKAEAVECAVKLVSNPSVKHQISADISKINLASCYSVMNYINNSSGYCMSSFSTKKEADEYKAKYQKTLKSGQRSIKVIDAGKRVMAEIPYMRVFYKRTRYKTKPKSDNKDCYALHKYLIAGWAAE